MFYIFVDNACYCSAALACLPVFGFTLVWCCQLLDDMEVMLADGGNIVDFHSSELFPERWFDVVLVLRTDNKVLYDRLVKR